MKNSVRWIAAFKKGNSMNKINRKPGRPSKVNKEKLRLAWEALLKGADNSSRQPSQRSFAIECGVSARHLRRILRAEDSEDKTYTQVKNDTDGVLSSATELEHKTEIPCDLIKAINLSLQGKGKYGDVGLSVRQAVIDFFNSKKECSFASKQLYDFVFRTALDDRDPSKVSYGEHDRASRIATQAELVCARFLK